ncbi:zf-HC2 domain-containing protein [Candidatus Sumerlaeota bacterium]|nr:zf-HC2 domain-containing protein [Candidatus Sumerlaeota bacterium]
MRCSRCQRLLSPLREGLLPPRTAQAVSSHLSQCGACREVAESERSVVETLEGLSPPPLEASLRGALVRRMIREAPESRSRVERAPLWPRLAWAVAPVLLVALVVGSLWGGLLNRQPAEVAIVNVVFGEVEHRGSANASWRPIQPGDVLPAGVQVMSRSNGMAILEMEGGSTVSLAPESTLSIVDRGRMSTDRGRVVIRSVRPLRVLTPAGDLHVPRGSGRLALDIGEEQDVSVSVTGYSVAWAPNAYEALSLDHGLVASLDPRSARVTPITWDVREWGWLHTLELARARQMIRETHPSLLPALSPER